MERWEKVSKNTDLFYNEIAKPFIDSLTEEVPCTYFDIRDYEKILRDNNAENDNELIALFKILSPTYLLKVAEAFLSLTAMVGHQTGCRIYVKCNSYS